MLHRQTCDVRTAKNIVITGGGRGLGKHLALNLAQRGHNVIITSRTVTAESPKHSNIQHAICNIEDPEQVDTLMQSSLELFKGQLDVLVNNAAQSNGYKSAVATDTQTIPKLIDTNLTGPMLTTKHLLDHATAMRSPCHIFNVIGAGSNGMPTPYYAVYGATKCALAHYSKSIQSEINDSKLLTSIIRIHMISPGMMPTQLLLDNLPGEKQKILSFFYEDPSEVAKFVASEMEDIIIHDKKSGYVAYMSLARLLNKAFRNLGK